MAKQPKGAKAAPGGDTVLIQAARLMVLFESNMRSSGRFKPPEKMWTEDFPAKEADWVAHVKGETGVGCVPILDDDTVMWCALDLDNHDSDEDIPIKEVGNRIAALKLPMIPVRSKSGGCHCYVFLEKPQPAARMRVMMAGWLNQIGYPGHEIFPKQSKLVFSAKDNEKQKGNWMNMPYFGGDETVRYAVVGGERLSLNEFLDLAEKSKITAADLRLLSSAEHPDAPPCIQKIFSQGVNQGVRNEALYNITVYYKKSAPENFEAKATAANQAVFSKPLPRGELQRTIQSAGRPDCTYRCNEEPIRSLCDRDTCVTRRFGITSGDLDRLNTVDALPTFSDLEKFMTEPVRWGFKIDGIKMTNISTEDLLDWRCIRKMVAERQTRIVPLIKNTEWERILHPLMSTARIIEAPDDASVSGVIRSRLREFAAKADLMSRGEDPAERKTLLRGLPVVQVVDGERFVVFRGDDFVNFLKRTKSEELKGVNLWFAIKELGIITKRLRIPGARKGEDNINVWGLPVQEALREDVDPVKYKSEL